MRWEKKGRIYAPDASISRRKLYGILPTPEFLPERNAIRIYFAATDDDRIGRIFSLEADAANPSRIIEPPAESLLSEGLPGAFDDCGVNPTSIVMVDGSRRLYYMGYQRSVVTPYLIFSSFATSVDGGSFTRYSNVPVLDRTHDEYFIRSAPMVLRDDDGRFRMWYVSASRWESMTDGMFAGRTMPVYVIRHARSDDGIQWNVDPAVCIFPQDDDEFGFGRPWVVRDGDLYRMWYSRRRRHVSYRIGYAESRDGLTWNRKDDNVGIDVSSEGWDSEMICYAAVVRAAGATYMFYNGNRNGESGFGYAVLAEA